MLYEVITSHGQVGLDLYCNVMEETVDFVYCALAVRDRGSLFPDVFCMPLFICNSVFNAVGVFLENGILSCHADVIPVLLIDEIRP